MHIEALNENIRTGRRRLVTVGLVSLAASLSAFAQTAATTTTTTTTAPTAPSDEVVTLSEFTVNGSYAGSLEMAAQMKENSDALTEVLAPEDIGQLPDVSIADALTRLTGLTSQRVNGRDQEITIRGFDPDYNVGMLDGVEQATTGDNRDVEYDQYPAELIGGVVVYKTGEADLVGGLGGTVDLQTTSPLSIDHRVLAMNVFYNWTALGELTPGEKVTGESYNISYVDQFMNGTEGIYIGYAHRENPYEGQEFQAWGYPTAPDGNLVLGGMRIYVQNDLLKSNSVVAVLESKPNDSIHSKIDMFLSYFDENQLLRGMEVPMAEWGNPTLQPGYTVTNGLITNYTLTNVNPVIRNMDTQWTTHLASVIWNLDVGEKSSWPVHLTAGWSYAEQTNEVLETYAGLGFNNTETDGGTWQVVQNAGPNPPSVVSSTNFANASLFSLDDTQGWGVGTFPVTGMEGYLKYFISYDIADSFKVFTKHELDASIFKDVEVGVGVSQRFKQFAQSPSGFLVNSNGMPFAPLPPLLGTTNLSFVGNLNPVAYDPNAALSGGVYKIVPNPIPGNWMGDDYDVWETITRPYVMFDLKGNVGGVPFTGNIGGVVDMASQNSNGLSGNGGTILYPVTGSASYADFLPTLNLIFKPTEKDLIRFFIGREEMRPTMYQMRAARDYSYNATLQDSDSLTASPWSSTSGNPGIHPWLANSADLDFEHYFAKGGGYFSVALFEKKLLTYIYQSQVLESFAGYPYTSTLPPVLSQGVASQYINGQGGNVSGAEATVQVGSEVFTDGWLKGFGIELNGLLVDSNIQPWGPGNGSAPLPDLSKKTVNATIYYESHGFSARVSEHYQSETREYIVQFGAPTFASLGTPGDGYSEEIPEHTIDAKVAYAFTSGWFKGLSVYLEGSNLNNEPLITYNNGDSRQLLNWQKYGAAYRAGVSYKF